MAAHVTHATAEDVVVMIEEKRGGASLTIARAILIGAAMLATAILGYAIFNRHEIISYGNGLSAWKIDKFTGDVWLCAGGRCVQMPN